MIHTDTMEFYKPEVESDGLIESNGLSEPAYILLYTAYEGRIILELGAIEFILRKHEEYSRKISEFNEKYSEGLRDQDGTMPDEYYLDPISGFDCHDPNRLCVIGYEDGKLKCVCQSYDETKGKKFVFY